MIMATAHAILLSTFSLAAPRPGLNSGQGPLTISQTNVANSSSPAASSLGPSGRAGNLTIALFHASASSACDECLMAGFVGCKSGRCTASSTDGFCWCSQEHGENCIRESDFHACPVRQVHSTARRSPGAEGGGRLRRARLGALLALAAPRPGVNSRQGPLTRAPTSPGFKYASLAEACDACSGDGHPTCMVAECPDEADEWALAPLTSGLASSGLTTSGLPLKTYCWKGCTRWGCCCPPGSCCPPGFSLCSGSAPLGTSPAWLANLMLAAANQTYNESGNRTGGPLS